MEIRLIKLSLRNFKGIRSLDFIPDGGNPEIRGKNGTGKSTVVDGYSWLLFDKDSHGNSDFSIKTIDTRTGEPFHNLEHEVEGIFEIDGKPLKLRKVYSEKWTKQRGSVKKTFTGHTTEYYIDDVPVQKKEFVERIASIADEAAFRLLSDPTYFNQQLHWKKRRETILDVCGDVSDEDVINSSDDLKQLPGILNGKKLDDYKKIIESRRKEINNELERIPVRIDEVQRELPDLNGIDADGIRKNIEQLEAKRREKSEEMSRIESGGEVAEKRMHLREVESEIISLRNESQEQINAKTRSLRDQMEAERNMASTVQNDMNINERTIKRETAEIASLEQKIETFRKRWYEVDGRQFTFEQAEVCPTCGQSIPGEQLEEARSKAQAAHNQQKAKELEEITAGGTALKEDIAKAKTAIAEADKRLQGQEKQLEFHQSEVQRLQDEIDKIKSQPVFNPKLDEAEKKKSSIEAEILKLQSGTSETADKVKEFISQIDLALTNDRIELAKFDQYDRAKARIAELEQQEKDLAQEFERLEHELYLTEEFIRSKVSLLEEKINSRFRFARFKMFETQVNGGISECCETLYDGVPYSSGLNTGHQILVGLDIINTLSEHYGFKCPVIIDNAESITEPIEIDTQVIRLVADKNEPKLRIEIASQNIKEAV